MIKSMRSWNDLEAGIEGEDAVEAVVLDGEVDARVRVLAELVVHGEDPARPTADEGCGGSTRDTDGTTSRRGHRCAASARTGSAGPCGTESARKRARVPSARQWEPCAFAGDTAWLGWAHNLMFRYTGVWLVLSN